MLEALKNILTGSDKSGPKRESIDIPVDDLMDGLSCKRRREVIHLLNEKDSNGGLEINELAYPIAAKENDKTIEELTDQEKKRVYVSLYQTHLPKMHHLNMLRYDKELGLIYPNDNVYAIVNLIEHIEQVTE